MIRESMASTPELKKAGATIGTKPWAEYRKQKLEEAVDQAIGGKIKFTAEAAEFINSEAWRHFLNANKESFTTFEAFCLHKRPYGLGCTRDDYFILISSYTQFKNKAQQSAMMAKEIGETAGGDKKSEHYQNHYYNCNNDSMEKQGNTSDYLTARIARDDPQVYADMLKGKYRSVRAAAIDAGIVDPEKTRRFQLPTDPVAAGRYLAYRVDKEWLMECVDAYMKEAHEPPTA